MLNINPVDEISIVYNKRISHATFTLEQRENDPSSVDIEFVAALIKNYGAVEQEVGEIWEGATIASKAVISHCLTQSPHVLNEQLNSMFATSLTFGFDQGHIVADAIRSNEASGRHILTVTIDKLLLLAQSLSLIPYFNAEQGTWRFDGDVDALLDAIQGHLPFDISFPTFYGGSYGVPTKYGLMTDRALMAISIASDMKKSFPENSAICEIGGGSGMLAYYLWKAGFKNISIIDLPEVGMCQAYFLKRNIPSAEILLNEDFSPGRTQNGIGIYKTDLFAQATQDKWDIVINVDSFPEMPAAVASDYLSRSAANGCIIVSINQESANNGQNIVPNLCKQITGIHRERRHPFWMRSGYVWETYAPTKQEAKKLNVLSLLKTMGSRIGRTHPAKAAVMRFGETVRRGL